MPDQQAGQVAVLIPAAGEGTRLGGRRKQFRRLGGEPLLVQTLRVFERHPEVDHLLVAAPTEATEALNAEWFETSDALQRSRVYDLGGCAAARAGDNEEAIACWTRVSIPR